MLREGDKSVARDDCILREVMEGMREKAEEEGRRGLKEEYDKEDFVR